MKQNFVLFAAVVLFAAAWTAHTQDVKGVGELDKDGQGFLLAEKGAEVLVPFGEPLQVLKVVGNELVVGIRAAAAAPVPTPPATPPAVKRGVKVGAVAKPQAAVVPVPPPAKFIIRIGGKMPAEVASWDGTATLVIWIEGDENTANTGKVTINTLQDTTKGRLILVVDASLIRVSKLDGGGKTVPWDDRLDPAK